MGSAPAFPPVSSLCVPFLKSHQLIIPQIRTEQLLDRRLQVLGSGSEHDQAPSLLGDVTRELIQSTTRVPALRQAPRCTQSPPCQGKARVPGDTPLQTPGQRAASGWPPSPTHKEAERGPPDRSVGPFGRTTWRRMAWPSSPLAQRHHWVQSVSFPSHPALPLYIIPCLIITHEDGLIPNHSVRPPNALPCGCAGTQGPGATGGGAEPMA